MFNTLSETIDYWGDRGYLYKQFRVRRGRVELDFRKPDSALVLTVFTSVRYDTKTA